MIIYVIYCVFHVFVPWCSHLWCQLPLIALIRDGPVHGWGLGTQGPIACPQLELEPWVRTSDRAQGDPCILQSKGRRWKKRSRSKKVTFRLAGDPFCQLLRHKTLCLPEED